MKNIFMMKGFYVKRNYFRLCFIIKKLKFSHPKNFYKIKIAQDEKVFFKKKKETVHNTNKIKNE